MWDKQEIEFYATLVPAMRTAPQDHTWLFPTCFDAAFAPDTGRSHLLLEDLSATHVTNPQPMPPTPFLRNQVFDAYACFHAFWWEHPWLGQKVGTFLTKAIIAESIETAQTKLARLAELAETEIAEEQLAILQTVAAAWPPRRQACVINGRGVTIVHRDPHPLNFLYPRNENAHTVKLIDWQSWRVDTGTDDLAYMMACHWPLVQQPQREREMLARYHNQLV